MELRHLRYFLAVAATQNFTRAADRLHVSQPSLSVQIRNLEDELGTRLFDRLGRTVQLTQAGELFHEHAERAMREMDIGICLLPISHKELTTVPLFDERLVLVAPTRSRLTQSRLRMQDLAGLPLILMPADYCLRKMVEAECTEARIKTQVVLEMTSPEGILQAVAEGAGLTILPELYVRLRLTGSGLRIIELYDPIPHHSVGLAYAAHRHQNRAAKEFGILCQTTMDELLTRPKQRRAPRHLATSRAR